jgi:class 3 adenylate cyclase
LGDQRWCNLLDAHHTTVRRELARSRGNEVKSLRDGFLATFDGPARAVRCARAISEAVDPLSIQVRSGLHTGEIEIAAHEVHGIAVHIASRVAALAGPGEVLVSRTVKDLVAGSGVSTLTNEEGTCSRVSKSRWTSTRYRIDAPSPAQCKPQGATLA